MSSCHGSRHSAVDHAVHHSQHSAPRRVFVRAVLFTILGTMGTSLLPSASAKVEAVRGKRYKLTAQHGPWMIMVAAFRDVPEERRKQGLTADQAANQVVYELRKMGVPAYTFRQSEQIGELKGFDRRTDDTVRSYVARQEGVAVLAGNYQSPDDKMAVRVLKFLKDGYEPKFLSDQRYGGIIQRTPGRQKALSRAHMTVNPLMSSEEIKRKSVDPLLKRLNADSEYALMKSRGRYSLRIATFRGTSITQVAGRTQPKAQNFFDKMMGDSLDVAGQKAWELTQALRNAQGLGYGRDFEAYVHHDRYQSYVTVGSFDSPNDPRIAQLAARFRGKPRMHEGREMMTAEVLTIPRDLSNGRQPDKMWMFDATPKLVDVPGR